MDRTVHPLAPCLAAAFAVLVAAACAPRPAAAPDAAAASAADSPAGRAARADAADAKSPLVAMGEAPAAGAADAPAGAWTLQESHPPRAVWGVPASEGQVVLGCDLREGQIVLERQAVGVPGDVRVVVLDADGVRMDYPAERRDDALAPVLVTRIALDAPILDRLLTARRVVLTAGADAIAMTAPGASLRAVVDACRRGPG